MGLTSRGFLRGAVAALAALSMTALGVTVAPPTAAAQEAGEPFFSVSPIEPPDHMWGAGWLPESEVQIDVDDPAMGGAVDFTTTISTNGDGYFEVFDLPFDIQAGQIVNVSQGASSVKTHDVIDLTISVVDPVADMVSGVGAADTLTYVNFPEGQVVVTSHGTGEWTADLGSAGFDIVPGTTIYAFQADEDWDQTQIDFTVPEPPPGPYISANISYGSISVWGFDEGPVQVVVSNSDNTGQAWAGEVDGEVSPEQLGFPLLPGMVIRAGDRVLEIPEGVTFDTYDIGGQVVAGGTPFGVVEVVLGSDQCSGGAEVIEGRWSFDVLLECSGFELEPNLWADARLREEDGDEIIVSFQWPRFDVNLEGPPTLDDVIEGQGWPYGTTLRIHVADENGGPILDTTTMVDGLMTYNGGEEGLYDFYGDASSFQFYEFPDGFRFQPGWTVEVRPVDLGASPWLTKTHTVTSLLPISVDLEADTVFGTAEPGSEVLVYGCAVDWETYNPEDYDGGQPWGAWSRLVDVDVDGNWEADFSEPGVARFGLDDFRPVDETCELRGYEFEASQPDSDFDETQRTVLIPAIFAGLNQGERIEIYRVNAEPKLVEIYDHPAGDLLWSAVVEPISDAGGGSSIEIGYETHGIDLQPGMLVQLPGGELVLAEVTLEFDIDNDIVFGTAPGSDTVQVDVGTDETWCSGEVPVVDGSWVVNPETLQGEGAAACAGFDLTKQSYTSISVGDPSDILRDFDGDRTRLDWETPPQWAMEEIAEFVDFLLGEADGKTANSLDKALDSIRQSLEPVLWVDYRTLDVKKGEAVFGLDAKAALELEKIDYLSFQDEEGNLNEFNGTDIANWLVFGVDRPLVELAIQRAAAAGGEPEWLAKASASLDAADDAVERGDPSKAIKSLGLAWEYAQRSLK